MNIYKNQQGYLVIEDVLGGEYKKMSYLYYTRREAIKLFKQEYKEFYHKNGHKKSWL
tara:strand:- start:226 stop:396 length:171 start_codon:yes stop_codon:yes gene_type:complete